MMLPETHVGELFDTALADLVQVVRAPEHPLAESLVSRARAEIDGGFDLLGGDRNEVEQAWADGEAEGVFLTLLAVASLLVEKGVEL
jgi:hypothetical protein